MNSFGPVYESNGSCVSKWTADFDFWGGKRTESNGSCVGKWTADFDFWGGKRTEVYDDYGCSSYDEVEFQAQTVEDEDDCGNCSLPFWAVTSPLLPYNHHYSYPSPKSRLQAIVDGRRELMEMIKDLPESSYELSLKDIVDEQHTLQADQKDTGIEERGVLNFKPEIKIKQQNKKKNCKKRQITRSESMDSGVFLLKMFFPISLGLKRKSAAGNGSKVSPRPSLEGPRPTLEGPEKIVNKGWWKARFLVMGESKNSGSSSITGSTRSRSSSSNNSRQDDINFTPGCWSFRKKYRSSRQRGCLL